MKFYRYDLSPVWDFHRDYFTNCGLSAWTKGEVPYTGISNFHEAFKKALLLIENLSVDLHQDKEEDIYLLEIGAGYGEFAYHFIEAFDFICKEKNLNLSPKLKYFISDFSEKTIQELKASKRLEKHLHRIEFLIIDVLETINIPHSFNAIIANYLLDQLPARVFGKSKDKFFEKYIAIDFDSKNLKAKKKFLKKIPKKFEFREINIQKEIKQDHLEILEQCFRKEKDSTVVYSYGSLKACNNMLKILKRNGILICSDFVATTKPGVDNFEPCYYGNSIAHPVNFEFILRYFKRGAINNEEDLFKINNKDLGQQMTLLYEDPIKPLHTLIITRPDFSHTLELGKIYKEVYYKNALLRMLYRFFVEIKLSLMLFLMILLSFLAFHFLSY